MCSACIHAAHQFDREITQSPMGSNSKETNKLTRLPLPLFAVGFGSKNKETNKLNQKQKDYEKVCM